MEHKPTKDTGSTHITLGYDDIPKKYAGGKIAIHKAGHNTVVFPQVITERQLADIIAMLTRSYSAINLVAQWGNIVRVIKAKSAIAGHILENAPIVEVGKSSFTINVGTEINHNAIKPNIGRIQDIVSSIFGEDIEMVVQTHDTPKEGNTENDI